jgi:hypothetical protein
LRIADFGLRISDRATDGIGTRGRQKAGVSGVLRIAGFSRMIAVAMRRAFIALIVLALPVSAGTIQWQQTLQSQVDTRGVVVSMKFEHTGDEAARELGVELSFADSTATRFLANDAPPGSRHELPPLIFAKPETPGWYPVTARLKYADMNGYPFSSIIVGLQKVDTPPELLLAVKPIDLAVAGTGRGEVAVRWNGADSIAVRVRIISPSEMSAALPDGSEHVTLEPGAITRIPVEFEAGDALAGAKYIGYLVLEGENEEAYHTGLGIIRISILNPQNTSTPWRAIAWAILLASFLLLAWPLLKRLRT